MGYNIEDVDGLESDFKSFLQNAGISAMVVDDSGSNRKMVSRYLNELGYKSIVEAKDGVDAIMKIPSMSERSIIILDLNMPRMDGFAFLERIRKDEATQSIPVIIMSTETEKSKVMRIMKLGVSSYLVKPFNAQELKGRLDKVLHN